MKSTDKNLIELFDDKKIYFDIITSNIFLGILFAVILWNSLSLLTLVFFIFSIIVVFKIYSNFAYKSLVKDGIIVEFIYIFGKQKSIDLNIVKSIKIHYGWGGFNRNWIRFNQNEKTIDQIYFIATDKEIDNIKNYFIEKGFDVSES